MLLIKFNFCSLNRLYILKIGIQLKNEEINWNSELQNPKAKPEAQNRELQKALANFARVAKFRSPCEILQGCEFSQPAN